MCSNSPNSPFCQRRKGFLLRRLIKKASDLASMIDNRLTAADRGSEVSDWIVDLSNERIGPQLSLQDAKNSSAIQFTIKNSVLDLAGATGALTVSAPDNR